MKTLRNPLLWFTVLLLTALSAFGQTQDPRPETTNSDWQPLLDLLSGKFGWLPTIIAWIGAVRVPMKLVSGWLQSTLTAFVARVAASPQTDDDAFLERVFGSIGYRFTAFLLDAALSLKLPTTDSLARHQNGVPVPINH